MTDSSPELVSCLPALHPSIPFSLILRISCAQTDRNSSSLCLSVSLWDLIQTQKSMLDQSKRKVQTCVKFSTFSLNESKPNFHTLALGVKFLLSSNIYPQCVLKLGLLHPETHRELSYRFWALCTLPRSAPITQTNLRGGKKTTRKILYMVHHMLSSCSHIPLKSNVLLGLCYRNALM